MHTESKRITAYHRYIDVTHFIQAVIRKEPLDYVCVCVCVCASVTVLVCISLAVLTGIPPSSLWSQLPCVCVCVCVAGADIGELPG